MIDLETLGKQGHAICEGFSHFEWVEKEYVPMCRFITKDPEGIIVCDRSNPHCADTFTFSKRPQSLERLAKLATKYAKGFLPFRPAPEYVGMEDEMRDKLQGGE